MSWSHETVGFYLFGVSFMSVEVNLQGIYDECHNRSHNAPLKPPSLYSLSSVSTHTLIYSNTFLRTYTSQYYTPSKLLSLRIVHNFPCINRALFRPPTPTDPTQINCEKRTGVPAFRVDLEIVIFPLHNCSSWHFPSQHMKCQVSRWRAGSNEALHIFPEVSTIWFVNTSPFEPNRNQPPESTLCSRFL